ncbi:MAG: AtpZ/AtpI family protein [Flavobacteriales bacterium]|nr:AtpZ/AtpI family protein [Flavobacteriales bacterium]
MAKEEKTKKKQPKFIALSGIGLQMGLTIYLFSYLGKFLDNKFSPETEYWTIGLILLGVVVSFYNLLRQVNKINDQEKHD